MVILAVGLFFLLSGFILAYTYEGQLLDARAEPVSGKARFARAYLPSIFFRWCCPISFATRPSLWHAPRRSHHAAGMGILSTPDMAGRMELSGMDSIRPRLSSICVFPLSFPGCRAGATAALFWLTAALLAACIVGHTPMKGLGMEASSAALFERVVPLPVLRIPEFLLVAVLGLRFLRDKTAQGPASRPLRV